MDNTREIIKSLIDEGLPVYFAENIEPKDMYEIPSILARKAIKEYGADLIVPLDADEFLYHTDGINPRETLEAMSEDIEYQCLWRTYVYENEPDIKKGFMPNNFTSYRNPKLDRACNHAGKTIMSKHLLNEKQARYSIGAHWLIYPINCHDTVKIEIPEKLVIAHFPLRSKVQVMTKAIANYIFKWKTFRMDNTDHQLSLLFREIKGLGEISMHAMKQNSIEYSLYNLGDKIEIDVIMANSEKIVVKNPMDISFCSDKLRLRYTDYGNDEKTFMRAVLTEIDMTVSHLSGVIDELTQKNNVLTAESDDLARHISDIYNSRSYRTMLLLKRIARKTGVLALLRGLLTVRKKFKKQRMETTT
jgi:hypothetical protein